MKLSTNWQLDVGSGRSSSERRKDGESGRRNENEKKKRKRKRKRKAKGVKECKFNILPYNRGFSLLGVRTLRLLDYFRLAAERERKKLEVERKERQEKERREREERIAMLQREEQEV